MQRTRRLAFSTEDSARTRLSQPVVKPHVISKHESELQKAQNRASIKGSQIRPSACYESNFYSIHR